MDVFDAAALGHLDRLRARLDEDPSGSGRTRPTASPRSTWRRSSASRRRPGRCSTPAPGRRVRTNAFANQPLHAAAAGRHIEVCRLLLGAGADVDATQHGGYPPLHEAAGTGDIELVELFLSAGADPSAQTDDGRTPADLAEAAGHPDVAQPPARGRRDALSREPRPRRGVFEPSSD